jgi:hypothetical protein
VLLDVWDMVLHLLHFISSSPLKNSQKDKGKKAGPHVVAVVTGEHQGYTHAHNLARQSSLAID